MEVYIKLIGQENFALLGFIGLVIWGLILLIMTAKHILKKKGDN